MSASAWDAAAAAEYGVAILALFILWIVCLVAVNRRKDPLRKPFLWLKWAIPFFFLFAACTLATIITNIVSISFGDVDGTLAFEINGRLSPVAYFFANTADLFILLCVVELGLSFLRALGIKGHHRIIRYSTFLVIAILAILTISVLGADEDYTTKTINSNFDGNISWVPVGDLYGSWNIIYWVSSQATTALSVFVLYSSVRQKRFGSLTRCHLATSLLNLARTTWAVYFTIKHYFNAKSTAIAQYVEVVDPILYAWITVSMFGLLIAIGLKRRGLWSNVNVNVQQQQRQGFVGNNGTQLSPPAYNQPAAEYGRYNLYQQPAQAEVVGSAPPVWGELPASVPWQQQQPQYQQQPNFIQHQNQIGNAIPVEAGSQPFRRPGEMSIATQHVAVHEVEASSVGDGMERHRWPSHHQSMEPQPVQVYEVTGTRDQKD